MTFLFVPSTPVHTSSVHSPPTKLCRPFAHFAKPILPYPPHHCIILPTSCTSSESSSDPTDPAEDDKESLLQFLPPKELKWSEIPFTSIEAELAAIDEYEREEAPPPSDPWPKFLRAAAYEHWGHPKLALAQYAKTDGATGLQRVPELWERRAYNAFKVGKVETANIYFELALSLMNESTGNEMHFAHWFNANFKDYLPKRNGPPAPVQRGIVKYCVGYPNDARNSFVPQIYVNEKEVEHPLLWFLACCAKLAGEEPMRGVDAIVVEKTLKRDYEWDPRLRMLVDLYYAAARRDFGEVTDAETKLSEAIKGDEKDGITTYVYLALYHDAFTEEYDERDRALDIVSAIGSPKSTNDTENYLFHVANNRLTIPDNNGDSSPDVDLAKGRLL